MKQVLISSISALPEFLPKLYESCSIIVTDVNEVLKPHPATLMKAYSVNRRMNDSNYDRLDCIQPIETNKQ